MAKSRVGVLGLGIMGSAMAASLLRAGFTVIGYDPLAACRNRHRKAGGIAAGSAREAAGLAGVLIASLASARALSQAVSEILAAGRPGQVVIETSTLPIPVKETARRRLAHAAGARPDDGAPRQPGRHDGDGGLAE